MAPRGARGGSGQLGTPRARSSHWTPRHSLGGSSEPPPKPPVSLPLTLQVRPTSILRKAKNDYRFENQGGLNERQDDSVF